MKTKLLIFIVSAMIFSGCSDLLAPADQNNRKLGDIYNDAAFAEGLLLNAYAKLPSGGYSFNDVATDDAVTNDKINNYLLMATGKWSAIFNPMDKWATAYSSIQYLNLFLEQADKVTWATTGKYVNEMFNDRMKGEAYGLRALYMYYLLQSHGGLSAGGQLLGVPILTASQDIDSDFRVPRNTFEECVQQIYKDLDMAESYLPLDYEDILADNQIPAKYAGKTTPSDYTRVFGAFDHQRLSARIVKGIRAQVSLLAASPAFSMGTTVTWTKAADDAASVLDLIGGVTGLAPKGNVWYAKSNSAEINNAKNGVNPPEILWRTNTSSNTNLETDNYPPTLYGKGRINPTQNLVDAFPMSNGYPIDNANGVAYDANNPYKNRDPRLALYIVVNGAKEGPSSITVYTHTQAGKTDDGMNVTPTSTRTGYYMRKLLREDVNLNPTSTTAQIHYVPRIRYTELFLAYAEAANEAWGPDGSGTHAYSARSVIAAIRKRAGIKQPDNYLASITSTDDMRKLIHNERRLELCFEGFRFWDLRRWKEDITQPANGVTINPDGTISVTPLAVENRTYSNDMFYGPLPYSEVFKWGLTQNAGW
ncbi:MAG TPA: RagB/SusD family nutrient uptake outer membrane protein [Paludibacter sp.]|nr:RagB/SusD family nutrient uptake outer membrane protein [Paludibacter sp.]